MSSRERVFELPAYRLAALEWGSGRRPVLALHGWLDNAGSFKLLGPRLEGCHVVGLDAAGHGLSGNRSLDSAYNIWQDVADIIEVAEQLGWDRFSLVGHSRGAGVAMLFASAFPDRVERVVFIDGGLPIVDKAAAAPENLARAVLESRVLRTKSGRVFASREQAIRERMAGFTKVGQVAAEILAERSLLAVGGGWRWRSDQRLKAQSEIKLTPELTEVFVRAVRAPIQCFMAEESPFRQHAAYVEMLPMFEDLELHWLPGGHHLHMEGAEIEIGRKGSGFLAGAGPADATGS